MEIVSLILGLIVATFSIISLISYFRNKGGLKKAQTSILENLSYERLITAHELEKLNKLYKLGLDSNTPIYSLTGSVGYVLLESNGGGVKEWLIADVLVANKSVNLLKKNNIDLEDAVVDDDAVESEIDDINNQLKINAVTEEHAVKEVEQILEKYSNNTIEFVIANPLRKHKPVHLLSYRNSKMPKAVNLLD